jgi:hypothetical protein
MLYRLLSGHPLHLTVFLSVEVEDVVEACWRAHEWGTRQQYLPKGEDLSLHSQNDLDAIAWALNTRPRKTRDLY